MVEVVAVEEAVIKNETKFGPEVKAEDLKIGKSYNVRNIKKESWATWGYLGAGLMEIEIKKVDKERQRVYGTYDLTGNVYEAPMQEYVYREVNPKIISARTGGDGRPTRTKVIADGIGAGLTNEQIYSKVFEMYPDQDPEKVTKAIKIQRATFKKPTKEQEDLMNSQIECEKAEVFGMMEQDMKDKREE